MIIWNCQFIFCPRVQRPHIDICAAIMLPVLFTYLQLRFRIIHWCNDHISLFPIRHLQFRFAFVFRVDILVSWQLWSLYGSGFIASVWTVEHHSYFKRMTHTHTHTEHGDTIGRLSICLTTFNVLRLTVSELKRAHERELAYEIADSQLAGKCNSL